MAKENPPAASESAQRLSVASSTAAPPRQVRGSRGLSIEPRNITLEPTSEVARCDTRESYPDGRTSTSLAPEPLRRRMTNSIHRAATFRTVEDFDDFDDPFSPRPGWQPGSEPGYDPALPDGGHASMPTLNAPCAITVVDFSHNHIEKHHFENQGFIDYLEKPQDSWVKCRWINVNGLSWDVLQAIGIKKKLHKLALEDVMNLRNRTKADWYPNNAYIVLTLQKLVYLDDDDESTTDTDSTYSKRSFAGGLRNSIKQLWRRQKEEYSIQNDAMMAAQGRRDPEKVLMGNGRTQKYSSGPGLPETSMLRTLQQYHGSSNEARIEFMERHSSLAPYKMAISAEQVSIFLTSDNTVISFFEASAGDIERPIVTRLSTPGTILRESYDASLLVQAIIDAIVDLALPLTTVYTEVIGDLELDVLTAPRMNQSRNLYICISEINKMLSFLNPIDNLVSVLRDHETNLSQEQAMDELHNPKSGILITPMCHTYLGDVLDHCIMIAESLQQLKRASDNLISLIFNTISSNQNESMKQLTTVTIIFLPLTFITGFFGQNFAEEGFPDIHHGIWYFWACAIPTAFATMLILMRGMIYDWIVRVVQRRQVLSSRKKKQKKKQRQSLLAKQ